MERLIKTIIMITMTFVVCYLSLIAQDTIIDTVYSIPELDGAISYNTQWGTYGIDTTYGGHSVGDWWSAISGGIAYGRMFLAYPLPDIPENYSLNSATMFVFQHFSVGNNEYWDYPIFNMETYDVEPPCLIEHIDYGTYLDPDDFNIPVLHPADTISTTSEQDWRSLEVTDWIIDDIENNRPFAQSRLRLSLDYDSDYMEELIMFLSGNTIEDKSYMIYEYIEDSNVHDDFPDQDQIKFCIYPNPISKNLKMGYFLKNQQNITIDLYNIKGQKLFNLFSGFGKQGRNEISLNIANLSNGIYLIKLDKSENKSLMKKILIQK